MQDLDKRALDRYLTREDVEDENPDEFYCPILGESTTECDRVTCPYTPCGFKRTGIHTK